MIIWRLYVLLYVAYEFFLGNNGTYTYVTAYSIYLLRLVKHSLHLYTTWPV